MHVLQILPRRGRAASRARPPSHQKASSWCDISPKRRAWLPYKTIVGARHHGGQRDARHSCSERESLYQVGELLHSQASHPAIFLAFAAATVVDLCPTGRDNRCVTSRVRFARAMAEPMKPVPLPAGVLISGHIFSDESPHSHFRPLALGKRETRCLGRDCDVRIHVPAAGFCHWRPGDRNLTERTQVSVLAGRLTRDLPCPSPVH